MSGKEVYEAVTNRSSISYRDICGGDLYNELTSEYFEQEPVTTFITSHSILMAFQCSNPQIIIFGLYI